MGYFKLDIFNRYDRLMSMDDVGVDPILIDDDEKSTECFDIKNIVPSPIEALVYDSNLGYWSQRNVDICFHSLKQMSIDRNCDKGSGVLVGDSVGFNNKKSL